MARLQGRAAPPSRDVIVRRALEIADDEGLEAVTTRRLAQDFGVTPMALYWHVRNKDELLEAMGDALFADMSTDVDASLPWYEQQRVVVDALVGALRAHPGAIQLAFGRILVNRSGLLLAERVLDLLREAGFGVRDAADVARHALRTSIMLVADEPGRAFGSPDEREALGEAERAHLAALPADRFPRVLEAVDALLACDDQDRYYEFGIDA